MLKIGLAQEIITPAVGVGLAGYINKRPNEGMYDDLYAKAVIFESNNTTCGVVSLDHIAPSNNFIEIVKEKLVEKFGEEFFQNLIICTTHTHTGPEYRRPLDEMNEATKFSYYNMIDAIVRCVSRAKMNLLPGGIEVGSVYNNPYAFIRRYLMKDGNIVTNPGWCNPNIEKPESELDRTIGIVKLTQNGRTAAIICNIANHGDTVGGSIVSADWYGRFVQAVQYELGNSIPVLVLDDCSGNVNHFDVRQKINQTCYDEAIRIGRGYAQIVLKELDKLETINVEGFTVKNTVVDIPHRKLTEAELAEAKHVLATVPDIPKEGDLESQDLANKVPAALRFFAQRAIDCYNNSTPSHEGRFTTIKFSDSFAITTIPGEPFNGIAQRVRAQSPYKYNFIVSLAQTQSCYVPDKECFAKGGYEVQPGPNSAGLDAADVLVAAALKTL